MRIKDIAKLSGVSVASVSRVINGNMHVLPQTRAKVMKAISESGYVPNLTGRLLRTQRSDKLLILVPNISNAFFSKIIIGMEDAAFELGYELLVAITNCKAPIEEKYINMLKTRLVDGIISFLSVLPLETLKHLSENYPIVQCCEPIRELSTSVVCIANRQAANEAVTYLIQKGRKRIALLHGHVYRHSEGERRSGYLDALRENRLEADSCLIADCEYTHVDAANHMDRLLALPPGKRPDAVFCCADIMAVGVMRSILKHQLQPGKDIDVIGFDNNAISDIFIPSITTVEQPRYEIGKTAVELLVEKINHPGSISKSITLPHRLIIRDSTGDAMEQET
ncbi:MAG TPA: LacI family DNA-binding transcriptional regulator [Candidatus Limiplasma sp.]|nr:LacI family DNA-binding transcriptional regulator [Candidatus Limiplasma sp.]